MRHQFKGRLRLIVLLVILIGLCIVTKMWRPRSTGPEWEWYNRGVVASSQGDMADAVRDFERAVEINPRFAAAYDLLAACYVSTGHVDRALGALDHLASVGSDHAYVSMRIAETYAPVNNRYMLRRAREAVLQGPRSPRAHMLLALGLARSGAGRAALAQADLAQQLSPSDEVAQSLKRARLLVGDPVTLTTVLQPLITRMPY